MAGIEKTHEERYRKLLKNVEEYRVFERDGKTYWQCRNCGYIFEGPKAPEVCPVCAHPQSFFEIPLRELLSALRSIHTCHRRMTAVRKRPVWGRFSSKSLCRGGADARHKYTKFSRPKCNQTFGNRVFIV